MIGVLTVFAVRAAVIYKWTDSDGVVHYSDQPIPGAEKIVTAGQPSIGSVSTHAPAVKSSSSTTAAGGNLTLSQFTITSPAAGQTFFGDEVISVNLAVDPPPTPAMSIVWHLNGKQQEAGANATHFSLQSLDRGTYAIAATITDQQTGESQSTESVTFYVRQPSEFSPLHK